MDASPTEAALPDTAGSGSFGVAPSTVVEYRGDRAVLVRVDGGRLYTFSPDRRARSVPAPDAEQLLANPLFRQDERRTNGTEQERT